MTCIWKDFFNVRIIFKDAIQTHRLKCSIIFCWTYFKTFRNMCVVRWYAVMKNWVRQRVGMKVNHIHPHPFPRKKSWLRSEYEKYTKSKSVLKCKYLEYHIYWRWSFSRTCLRISRCCMVPHWRKFLCNLAITERRCANAFIYSNLGWPSGIHNDVYHVTNSI